MSSYVHELKVNCIQSLFRGVRAHGKTFEKAG